MSIVEKTTKLRDSICAMVGNSVGVQLEGARLLELAQMIHSLLPRADLAVILDTIRPLAGSVVTAADAADLGGRIAGNVPRLLRGEVVPRWCSTVEAERIVVEVLGVVRHSRRFRDLPPVPGAMLALRPLTGLPAGRQFLAFWSSGTCHAVKTHFGFDRFNRLEGRTVSRQVRYPFAGPGDLGGLWFEGVVDPTKTTDRRLDFTEVGNSAAVRKSNRVTIAKRLRYDYECPEGYSAVVDCADCHMGRNGCAAACRRTTATASVCERCGDVRYFDVAVGRCLTCGSERRRDVPDASAFLACGVVGGDCGE